MPSAVLHRFIADKVRNCQVFNPIVSILFQAFSVHRLLGAALRKSVSSGLNFVDSRWAICKYSNVVSRFGGPKVFERDNIHAVF
jgi:hypothetical protein